MTELRFSRTHSPLPSDLWEFSVWQGPVLFLAPYRYPVPLFLMVLPSLLVNSSHSSEDLLTTSGGASAGLPLCVCLLSGTFDTGWLSHYHLPCPYLEGTQLGRGCHRPPPALCSPSYPSGLEQLALVSSLAVQQFPLWQSTWHAVLQNEHSGVPPPLWSLQRPLSPGEGHLAYDQKGRNQGLLFTSLIITASFLEDSQASACPPALT